MCVMPNRIFLLSPARCGGKRASLVVNDRAEFDLARRLRDPAGVELGELFSFLSGLYFRGKLAYARAFCRPPHGIVGTLVITPNRGLLAAETLITLRELRRFARAPIDKDSPRYRRPLVRDAKRLAGALDSSCEVVLLGSIATAKYVDLLADCFGDRLRFPAEFVGRGDMSRGGLMLRCVAARHELQYIAANGANRTGPRPGCFAKV